MIRRRLRNFISQIDQFLTQFNKTNPPSASQLAEINKYRKLNRLRDLPKESKKR